MKSRIAMSTQRFRPVAGLRPWVMALLLAGPACVLAQETEDRPPAAEAGTAEFDFESLLGPEQEKAPSEQEKAKGQKPAPGTAAAGGNAATEKPQAAPPTRKTLENIVVVAQKKEESIQDVPVSISVIDDQFIEDWSITDINSAVLYTPNVRVADAGYFILPRIRGFGTDQNNKAFEPPAGVAIDGIPYTRLEYFTSALFDVQRMEILRGPQGTTFGKNTTAGLIHILSNNPTDDYQGFMDLQAGEFDRRRFEGAVGGPLIEGFLNFRVAGLSDEREGTVKNSATDPMDAPEVSGGNSRQGFRMKLDFVDLLSSSLKLSYENVDIEATGSGMEMFDATPTMQAVMRRYDPNTDFKRGNYVGTITDADFRTISLETYTADWRYDVGDWGLVGLGGYSVLKGEAALDIDGSPVPSLSGTDSDTSPTTTFELRLESPELDGFFGLNEVLGLNLGSSNFLAGLYYQKREIRGDGIGFRFGLPILELLVAGEADNPGSQIPSIVGDILELLLPVVPPLTDLPLLSDYGEEAVQDFDQSAVAKAVFGQFEWSFLPQWGVQVGLRLNTETKRASFNQQYASPEPNIILRVIGVEEFQTTRKISEDQVAPRVALSYALADDFNVFLHWARGFRGGGFNAFAFRNNDEELLFSEETAEDWGLDFKTQFWDGRARLNVSLFRLDVTDFQVLTSREANLGIGLGQSIVENAPKARSQGIEADFTWLAKDWLTLFSTLGVNDTEYLDFTFGGCFADNRNTDGDDDPRCDATGKPFPLTPKYTGTLLAMATLPLSRNGLVAQIGGGLDYQSEQFTNFSLDERYKQDDVTRWRASVGIGNVIQGWSFKIQGENLTDEIVTVRQGQTNKGYVLEALEAPRTIYASFRYKF